MKKISLWFAVVVIGMSIMFVQPVKATSFPDVVIYKDEINYLANKKIIRGFEDGTFGPTKSLTRLQAVEILLNAKGVTDYTAPDPQMTDMHKGKYGYDIVSKAVQLGIISGKINKDGSKYFDPANVLTRGQMAKILVETAGIPINRSHSFPDILANNDFLDYISTMAAERITGGYEDGTYRAAQTLSRAHFAVFVARMLDDKFKPAIVNGAGSYMLNTNKIYTWEYKDEGQLFIEKLTSSVADYEGPANWNLWTQLDEDDAASFITMENDEGLFEITCHYVGSLVCPSDSRSVFTALKYPLNEGKKWEVYSGGEEPVTLKVESINRKITTRAGSFENVVEVTDSEGWTYYYARNIGLIKSLENGKAFAELIKLENK